VNRFAISTADCAAESAPILMIGSIGENIMKAAKLGYGAIEVHTTEDAELNYDEIAGLCNDYNVRIATVVTGRLTTMKGLTLTNQSPDNRKNAVLGMKAYVRMAQRLGADVVVGWVRGNILPQQNKENYMDILSVSLGEVARFAEDNGVKVFIEAINRYEINSFNRAAEIVDFIKHYGQANLYAHLDTFHMNIEEANMIDAILCSEKYLGYMHFADSNRRYPGVGHLDFLEISTALKKINYSGYFSIECLSYPTHEAAAKAALGYMQNIFCL